MFVGASLLSQLSRGLVVSSVGLVDSLSLVSSIVLYIVVVGSLV